MREATAASAGAAARGARELTGGGGGGVAMATSATWDLVRSGGYRGEGREMELRAKGVASSGGMVQSSGGDANAGLRLH